MNHPLSLSEPLLHRSLSKGARLVISELPLRSKKLLKRLLWLSRPPKRRRRAGKVGRKPRHLLHPGLQKRKRSPKRRLEGSVTSQLLAQYSVMVLLECFLPRSCSLADQRGGEGSPKDREPTQCSVYRNLNGVGANIQLVVLLSFGGFADLPRPAPTTAAFERLWKALLLLPRLPPSCEVPHQIESFPRLNYGSDHVAI